MFEGWDHDDFFREDPFRASKGVLIGVVIGGLFWAGTITAVVFMLK